MATFLTSDGVRLFYERVGAGPRLYACIGGPNNDHRYLAEDLSPLADEFELVHHDYRGCGQSASAPAETYTFERLADDLDELRTELGDEEINVLGHSMGGFVAQYYGARHPEHARRLVLAGTYATTDPREFTLPTLRALGWARLTKLIARGVWFLAAWSWQRPSLDRTRRLWAIWGTTQEGLPAVRAREQARERRLGLPVDNDNVPALRRLFRRLDTRNLLSAIRCRVLVLYGDRDAAAVGTAHILCEHLADADVIVIPGVGHDPFFEAPGAALESVREFFR
jgi:pimeloyl-ACP methyl ester carboxylesterase